MFLSDASVKRPVAMSCLIIGLLFLGANEYRKFPLELMPKVDIPYVTVVTTYPGASPSDIEVDVAKRIEDAVSQVDGVKHITSSCMENVCQTLIEFRLGTNVDVSAVDVREKIDAILNDFPSGVEKPSILKFDINAQPVVVLALTGALSIDDLYDYADNDLSDRLSIISGVAKVELQGGAEREVHVLLNRDAVSAAGLTSLSVIQALSDGVLTLPAGRVRENGTEYSVRYDAEYSDLARIGDLQVAGKDGARRYIRDLGQVRFGTEERRQQATIDGRPCIGIRVVKKADANAVSVVNAVRKVVDQIRPRLPGGMELVWVSDDGAFIESNAANTTQSIEMGILLTAAILFFFLYNFRATLIVALTMPITIVIAFLFMGMMDFTLNTSTLLALGLSVGVLVTNSIVVLESVVGRLQQGDDPWTAARHGTDEVAVAVMASAGTNVVVLFPIATMGSIVGLFFRPFSWTTLIVNVVSLFISFTLTPILCAILFRKYEKNTGLLGRMESAFNGVFSRVAAGYADLLHRIGSRRWAAALVLAGVAVFFFASMKLGGKVGFSFVPKVDRGIIYVKLEFPTRQDLTATVRRVQEVEAMLKDLPGVRHSYVNSGKAEGVIGRSSEGVYLAQIFLRFVEKTERDANADDLLVEIRRRLSHLPDAIVTVSVASLVGGQSTPIEMEIAGDNLPELERVAERTLALARAVPGVAEADTSVRPGKPEIRVRPTRPILADLGASVRNLGLMVYGNLEGTKAAIYRSGARTYDIRVKFAEEEGKRQIEEFQVPSGTGRPVLLSNFASIEERRAPILITRVDKSRVHKLYGDTAKGAALGTVVSGITSGMEKERLLPPGYTYRQSGEVERMGEAVEAFLEAAILAVVLTYLTLAAILESFLQPFFILTTLPLGLIGILWALFLAGESMNIFVLLGSVMLVGIVVNNAILVLSHAQALIAKGVGAGEAMIEALEGEFRAVVMITCAAVLGMMPLALSRGLGSEQCSGIGIASAGGILVSAALTFLVLPLVYFLFHKPPEHAESKNHHA